MAAAWPRAARRHVHGFNGAAGMIPDDIHRFILTSVPSIPYLEAALLLRRESAEQWSAKRVSEALYISHARAAELLSALASAGVVAPASDPDLYRYAPRDATLGHTLDRLAEIYRTDMIGVTQLVHDTTQRSAQRLADAFKLRKDG